MAVAGPRRLVAAALFDSPSCASAQAPENVWLNEHPPYDVTRREERHFIASQLFAASDAEAAYSRAVGMLPGLSDANNDGPGHRTNVEPLGIFDLDDVSVVDQVEIELNGPYGIDVGVLFVEELQRQQPRPKQELSLFTSSKR